MKEQSITLAKTNIVFGDIQDFYCFQESERIQNFLLDCLEKEEKSPITIFSPEHPMLPYQITDWVREELNSNRERSSMIFTFSYIVLKEFDLQATSNNDVQYISFKKDADGYTVECVRDFAEIEYNPIIDGYMSLLDRELTRSTGRNRKGERV